MPEHIRLISPTVIAPPPGAYPGRPGLLLLRSIGEALTPGGNVTEEQARELLESGDAVDAYGDLPRWE